MMMLIHLFLSFAVPPPSETITGQHWNVNELGGTHIFSTSLNQPLESSISRFIDSIPFTGRSTGSLPATAVLYLPMMRTVLKNWTMDSLWVNMFVRVRGPLPLSYIAQLRRARVLPTTVRAATVVEKHIIEHYSRSLSLLCVVKIYTMLYAGAQIASISLYRQYVCGIFRYGREFRKNRLNEAIISRGKMTEKHVFVMFSPLVLVCKHTSFTVQHCRGASLCCWK